MRYVCSVARVLTRLKGGLKTYLRMADGSKEVSHRRSEKGSLLWCPPNKLFISCTSETVSTVTPFMESERLKSGALADTTITNDSTGGAWSGLVSIERPSLWR